MIQQPRQVTHQLALVDIFSHGPIHHGLATPFLSYRVTLNARKTRDFIRDLIIWQSYKLGPTPPMLGFVDKFVMIVLLLVRHVLFWVIIFLHRRLH